MSSKEYFITKLTFRETERLIKDISVYEYDNQNLSDGETQDRNWLINKTNNGCQISTMSPNPEKSNSWIRGKLINYTNGIFSWGITLPLNSTKHKTFVSYYHKDDEKQRERFERLFRDLIISKSVQVGDIDSDNSDGYIKQLIQKDFLSDTTVLVILIGPKTKCRMHIDWEISGALNLKVGYKYAGLLGVLLPNHPDYGTGKYTSSKLPARFNDNLETGYAIIRDWTDDRVKMQSYIEDAFSNRNTKADQRVNSRKQMDNDTCE